ncbi:MAG: hypothetical protein ACXWOV_02790 [Isosphaeraceae bacterium]
MFELTVDGERVPWTGYVEVFTERFVALTGTFFSVPYLTKNGER